MRLRWMHLRPAGRGVATLTNGDLLHVVWCSHDRSLRRDGRVGYSPPLPVPSNDTCLLRGSWRSTRPDGDDGRGDRRLRVVWIGVLTWVSQSVHGSGTDVFTLLRSDDGQVLVPSAESVTGGNPSCTSRRAVPRRRRALSRSGRPGAANNVGSGAFVSEEVSCRSPPASSCTCSSTRRSDDHRRLDPSRGEPCAARPSRRLRDRERDRLRDRGDDLAGGRSRLRPRAPR